MKRHNRVRASFLGVAGAVVLGVAASRAGGEGASAGGIAERPFLRHWAETAAASDAQAAAQDTAPAQAFLNALRGRDPAVCELVSRGLENRWGGGFAEPVVYAEGGADPRVQGVIRWATSDTRQPPSSALTAGLSEPDACVRRIASQLLGQRGDSNSVDVLLDALRSGDARAAESGALGLGYAESERALAGLIDALRVGVPLPVRRTAAWALGRVEHESAIPALSEALRDPDVPLRANAAWALGEIENARALPALSTALRDADPFVRRNAALALGKIEDRAAIPALAETLERDQDAHVRRAAAWALGQIDQ